MINKISAALKQRHFGELQDYCHALKGNSLSIGAQQLANTTESLSKLGPSIPATKSQEILDQLNTDFAKLTLAVEDYLRRPEVASK